VAGRRGRLATADLLDPADALARLRDPGALDRFSALGPESPLQVGLRGRATVGWTGAGALSTLPCPSLALVDAGDPAPGFDLVVESEDALRELTQKIRRNPLASLALVQLLRLNEGRSLHEGLVGESLVYSTLQSGPEFLEWLAARPTAKRRPAPEGPAVRAVREGDVLHLTLNRPAKRNAFSAEMRDALCEGLVVALADESIARVLLRGEGPCFCSGGDLDEFGTLPDPASAHAIRTTRNPGRLLSACAERVRARVHGACVGAGIELPAFAAHVSASADASFRLPEVSMGLVPGAGGTASLTRRIGRQRTAWMALPGEAVDAGTALAWGLVDEIVQP
jgi:enoyl-CoA hydratase/carnithine racemase